MKIIDIKRTDAANLIEYVRNALLEKTPHAEIEKAIEENFHIEPLKECVHESAFIDNCPCCMPRWQVIGPRVRIRLQFSNGCFLGPFRGTQHMLASDFAHPQDMDEHLRKNPKDIIYVGVFKGSKVDIRLENDQYVLRLGIISNWVSSQTLPKLIEFISETMPDLQYEYAVVDQTSTEGPSEAFLLETLKTFFEGKMGYVNVGEHICMRPMKGKEDRYEMVWEKSDDSEGRFEGSFEECLGRAEGVAKTLLRCSVTR